MSNDSLRDLLKIKERLDHNLSGAQISQVLDDLIYSAATPIMRSTNFFDHALVELLPMIFANNRRKYSNMPRQEFIDLLFSSIMVRNRSSKIKILRTCRIERTVLFKILDGFHERTRDYSDNYRALFNVDDPVERSQLLKKLAIIENDVAAVRRNVYNVLQWSIHCYDLAQTFKGMIIEKYVRLAYNEANKASKQTKLNIDKVELFKNLILSTSKAIDKYDPEKGALTSYIRWWFMDGINQSNNKHEYGVAFYVPTTQRKKILANHDMSVLNFSVSLDDCVNIHDPDHRDMDDALSEQQEDQFARRLVRHADKQGMAMLALNIHYPLSPDEIMMLRQTTAQTKSSRSHKRIGV